MTVAEASYFDDPRKAYYPYGEYYLPDEYGRDSTRWPVVNRESPGLVQEGLQRAIGLGAVVLIQLEESDACSISVPEFALSYVPVCEVREGDRVGGADFSREYVGGLIFRACDGEQPPLIFTPFGTWERYKDN